MAAGDLPKPTNEQFKKAFLGVRELAKKHNLDTSDPKMHDYLLHTSNVYAQEIATLDYIRSLLGVSHELDIPINPNHKKNMMLGVKIQSEYYGIDHTDHDFQKFTDDLLDLKAKTQTEIGELQKELHPKSDETKIKSGDVIMNKPEVSEELRRIQELAGMRINEKKVGTEEMINMLNKQFPSVRATPASEFYGRASDGIWFRGSEDGIDDLPVYSDFVHPETMGVHPDLDQFLTTHGWFAEPYDAGTLMAYPA